MRANGLVPGATAAVSVTDYGASLSRCPRRSSLDRLPASPRELLLLPELRVVFSCCRCTSRRSGHRGCGRVGHGHDASRLTRRDVVVGTVIDRVGRGASSSLGTCRHDAAAVAYLLPERIGLALCPARHAGVCFAAALRVEHRSRPSWRRRTGARKALGIFGVSTLLTHAIAPAVARNHPAGGFNALFLTAAVCTLIPIPLLRGSRRARACPSAQSAVAPAQRHARVLFLTMALTGMGFGREHLRANLRCVRHNLAGGLLLWLVLVDRRPDARGRRRAVRFARAAPPSSSRPCSGFASAILALAAVQNVWMLVFAGLLFGAAQGMSYPTLQAFLIDVTPGNQLGRSQAYFNGAFNLGVMSSAFLFGVVADAIGQRFMFCVAAVTPVLAALVFHAGSPGAAVAARGAAAVDETTVS